MFSDSVRQASAHFHRPEDSPFVDLSAIPDRPLLVVVPWPDALITDQEHDLSKELMVHFAGALLLSD